MVRSILNDIGEIIGWKRSGSDKIYSSEKRAQYAERRSEEGKIKYYTYNPDRLGLSYDDLYNKVVFASDIPEGSPFTERWLTTGTDVGRGFETIYMFTGVWDNQNEKVSLSDMVGDLDQPFVPQFIDRVIKYYSGTTVGEVLKAIIS